MWVIAAAALSANNVSFAPWNDGFIEVLAPGIQCIKTENRRFQKSYDSAAVKGTTRPNPTTNRYGAFETAEEVIHESGLFVPEFNTGVGASGPISNKWNNWVANGDASNAYTYKYAPTGMAYARDAGSVKANVELAPFLDRLPGMDSGYNYSKFADLTEEPWRRRLDETPPRNDFPGLLPAIHPVLDKKPESERKRYAVRPCPNQDDGGTRCCLVVENGGAGDVVNPVPSDSHATNKLSEYYDGEKKVRWRQLAFHTSFSRGLPDIWSYDDYIQDLASVYGGGDKVPADISDKLHTSSDNVKTDTGEYTDPSNGQNEGKCRKRDGVGLASYYTMARLEHFYTAVVGVEEHGMLRQKPASYEGDLGTDSRLKNVPGDQLSDDEYTEWGTDNAQKKKKAFNYIEDHDCSAQPGGNCAFGYHCTDVDINVDYESNCFNGSTKGLSGSEIQFMPVCIQLTMGKCPKGRMRGRPELLRYNGDGLNPPVNNYKSLAHVLDGEDAAWYDEEYRMSARLVYTGPSTDHWKEQGENELPCSTTRMDGAYKRISGEFTRSCAKMRATKFEWLVTAMLQAQRFPSDDLHHAEKHDDGFSWETDRGIGPKPCSLDATKCFANNKRNRVRLWDLDSVWTFNRNNNEYQGAGEDSDYYKNLKSQLERTDGLKMSFLHYNENYKAPSAQEMTSFGGSDGTSRTNAHAQSCYLGDSISTANAEGDKGGKFLAGDDDKSNYFSARPSLWPYTWGTMRAINADVDATYPLGCDLTYGPPCEYADAVEDAYHNSEHVGRVYRGAVHHQGGAGVFGCQSYKKAGISRATWDYNKVKGLRKYPTGSHTCANLMNTTHFKLSDFDVEEWDMRSHLVHKYGKRNCDYDDHALIYCAKAGISLNCHNAMSPIDNTHHTYIYKEGDTMAAKFIHEERRFKAKESPAARSPNYDKANEDGVWVNWGNHTELGNNQDNVDYSGNSLSNKHSPYRDGKDDGILECGRPRDDLLLHSLLKRTRLCNANGQEDLQKRIKAASPCAAPVEYEKWRNEISESFDNPTYDDYKFAGVLGNENKYANGRTFEPSSSSEFDCQSPDYRCNVLARTTRVVVGNKVGEEQSATPYAPEWVHDKTESTPWCAGDTSDDGFVPRRACLAEKLKTTDIWSGRPIDKNTLADVGALDIQDANVHFVQREHGTFSLAELTEMRACVNTQGTLFCKASDDIFEVGAAPTIGVLANTAQDDKFAVILKPPLDKNCEEYFNTESEGRPQLNGLKFTQIGIDNDNVINNMGSTLCMVDKDSESPDGTNYDAWKLDLDDDFRFPRKTVNDKIGFYQLKKLKQCLAGSADCPIVDFHKDFRVVIPIKNCPRPFTPKIMYRCFEDNDVEDGRLDEGTEALFDEDFMTEALEKEYGVRSFKHRMYHRCIDKIQFAIECNFQQELHQLDNDVCNTYDFAKGCQPTRNTGPLRAAMCMKPLAVPEALGAAQFYLSSPPDRKLKTDTSVTSNLRTCNCKETPNIARLLVKAPKGPVQDTDLCADQLVGRASLSSVFEPVSDGETGGDFNASICTPTYREVDLHDYRQSVPMHIYWRHCSALRLDFEVNGKEVGFTSAFVYVSAEISDKQSKFLAKLPMPLDNENVEKYDGGSVMWGLSKLRELVPSSCQGTSDVMVEGIAVDPIFTREVEFDFEPGEPFAAIELGNCIEVNETICTKKRSPIYFKDMQPHGFDYGLLNPIKTSMVSALECAVECNITAGCQTFAYTGPEDRRCLLFDQIPRVVKLEKENVQQFNPMESSLSFGDTAGFGTCFNGKAISVFDQRAPVPPPPICPSGKTLVPKDFTGNNAATGFRCVKSACNPDTEVAVPIRVTQECDERCMALCDNAYDTLSTYAVNTPVRWATVDVPAGSAASVTTEYAEELDLALKPVFEFIVPESGRSFLDTAPKLLREIRVTLPPVQLKDCNPCGTAGTTECHNAGAPDNGDTATSQSNPALKANVTFVVKSPTMDVLFNGTAEREILSGTSATYEPHILAVTQTIDNLPIEEYEYVLVEVTVALDPLAHEYRDKLEYNVNGMGCGCEDYFGVNAGGGDCDGSLPWVISDPDNPNVNVTYGPVIEPNSIPKKGQLPSVSVSVCNAPHDPPEVCLPRSECDTRAEYVVDEGSLERDRSCGRLTECLNSEYTSVNATLSTDRRCTKLIQCGDFEQTTKRGTPLNQVECTSLERCNDTPGQYRDTQTKFCAEKTVCEGQMTTLEATDFSDTVCTEYQVICNQATEFEEVAQTPTSEATCASYTVCEADEFSLSEATVSTNRKCKPLQKCKIREIYVGPNTFEEDAVCTPILRFGWAWIIGGIIAACYLVTAFYHVIEDQLLNFVGKRR